MKRWAPVAILLAAVAVYARVTTLSFINYDDPAYVTANEVVKRGLTLDGIAWAFTTGHAGNWHPLTWISHMLDVSWFGLNASGHHGTSLVLHLLNTLLVLLVFRKMTGQDGPSLFTAAVFALHPLRVESVAWIAERKDVLCGTFWLCTMLAYAHYAARPSRGRYAVVVLAFALGLMAKPMLVTLPFVLLLTDVWPLARTGVPWSRRVWEKTPLFAAALASSVVTFLVQRAGGAMQEVTLAVRASNAVVSYGKYLWKTFVPTDMTILYPHPGRVETVPLLISSVALVAITVPAVRWLGTRPWWSVGWFWFLGTLVPVIGVVAVGGQAMADRYMYLPQIGVSIMVIWGVAAIVENRPGLVKPVAVVGAVYLLVLGVLTGIQVGHFKDSITVFEHALRVAPDNAAAHLNLGAARFERGEVEAAIAHHREVVRLDPDRASGHANLARGLVQVGRVDEAETHFARAIAIAPDAGTHYDLGNLRIRQKRFDDAAAHLREAIALDPGHVAARTNLAAVLTLTGRVDEAIGLYREALRLDPDYADAHVNLGATLLQLGKLDEAEIHFRRAVAIKPEDVNANRGLEEVLRRKTQGG